MVLIFLFVLKKNILNSFLFFLIILSVVLPIEPVDPNIAIFFFFIIIELIDKKMEMQITFHQFYRVSLHDLV